MVTYKGVQYESCSALLASGNFVPIPEPEAKPKAEEEAEPVPQDSPPGLDDVIGNAPAVLQIRTALDAHRERVAATGDGRTKEARALVFPSTLLTGSAGLGKTMLAEIIARELKRPIRLQTGHSLDSPVRVSDVLRSLNSGEVLFIDEMHGLKDSCQETLYRAMENSVLVPIVKGYAQVDKPIRLLPFTLIGSTTDESRLLPPLLQRFKYHVRLERMTAAELAEMLLLRAARHGWFLDGEAARMIADRAGGTPRLAIRLLDGCMDTAIAQGGQAVDANIVRRTSEIWRLAEAAKGIGTETLADRGQANGGYVYALLNSAMPGLVKIGKTERAPDDRAKELSVGTGIPTPFLVAYAEWFKDCCAAEGYVHSLLEEKGFRVAQNREFFCAPVKAVVQAILKAKEREDRSGDLPPETGAVG